jgi:hypothetical protein
VNVTSHRPMKDALGLGVIPQQIALVVGQFVHSILPPAPIVAGQKITRRLAGLSPMMAALVVRKRCVGPHRRLNGRRGHVAEALKIVANVKGAPTALYVGRMAIGDRRPATARLRLNVNFPLRRILKIAAMHAGSESLRFSRAYSSLANPPSYYH